MNKNELIRLIYTTTNEILDYKGNITLNQAETIYDTLVGSIKDTLVEGEEVRLPGFGRWYINHSGARTIPHPKLEGQTIDVGPTRQVRFKVYPSMKDQLNGRA